jgi:SNF2 family DNA or RNA helicase
VRPDKVATLKGIFPAHHRVVHHGGEELLALPHTIPVTRVLRNMGIRAPSPIRYYYDWPRPARFTAVFDHQYTTAEFLTLHNKCFVLNEMGTSKTASALWAADYLMRIGHVKKVLICATLSTLESVWLNEIFDVCMHRNALVLHADAEKRREMLARDVDFYIINHAGLKIIGNEIIRRKDIDLVIVDEASVYRNAQTEQYEILERVVREKKLWLLTGAPAPNAPTDVWALARLVNKSLVPAHFTAFKRKTMSQVSTYKWVPRPGSHETAFAALQPAIRFKKSDCLTLPPVTYTTRKCELEPEQLRAYEQMKLHLVAEVTNGASPVTAVNAADKIAKLRQILCGAIKGADGNYVVLPHGKRLKILQEYIEQAAAKVLVIVPFKGIARVLEDELNAWHQSKGDGRRVKLVNGDVSLTERNRIFQDFRDDPDLTELVCHPQVMAHGLNMTQADMLVFYAPIYSNDQSGQVMDRINRPGQTMHMTVGRIVANPLEQGIYAMVEGRQQGQMNMLELFRKEVMG